MKNSLWIIVSLLVYFVPDAAFAQTEIPRADAALNGAISDFVTGIMNDGGSHLNRYTNAMMIGMGFIGIAWFVINWAITDGHWADLLVYFIGVSLIFTFWGNYNEALTFAWGYSDALGAAIQLEAVGNADPLFIGSSLIDALSNYFLSDISLLTQTHAIGAYLMFQLCTGLLKLVISIASLWHIWGYAFAKVSGILFLPMLFLPITRGFFDQWFKIFLGFFFFNVFARISLSLFYIYWNAIFGIIDSPVEVSPISQALTLSRMQLHMFIGIIFFLATGGLASMMASGFGGFSSAAGRAGASIKNIAVAIANKIR